MKEKKTMIKQSIHLKKFNPYEILSKVITGSSASNKIEIDVDGVTYSANLNSRKLRIFAKSRMCAECGREGNVMYLERFKQHNNNKAFFVLYCEEDGKSVEMSLDHVIPVAQGGKDGLYNCQTLCRVCNEIKADMVLSDFKRIYHNVSSLEEVESFLKENNVTYELLMYEPYNRIMYFYLYLLSKNKKKTKDKRKRIIAKWNRVTGELRF